MTDKLNPGDIVRLKCGGPRMVIAGVVDRHGATGPTLAPAIRLCRCVWVGDHGSPFQVDYGEHVLMADAPRAKPDDLLS